MRCEICGEDFPPEYIRDGECPGCRAKDRENDMAVGDSGR